MQKWHIHPAIGRASPLSPFRNHQCCPTLPRHHFHTSPPHSNNQDKVTEEPAVPLSSRTRRLENANLEVQNLYLRHANKDKSPLRHRNTALKSVLLGSAPKSQPPVIDKNDMGVPFGKKVLEGKSFAPRLGPITRVKRELRDFHREGEAGIVNISDLGANPGGVLDRKNSTMGRHRTTNARSQNAKPEGNLENTQFTMGRTGAVDARSLGATPESGLGNRPFTIRRTGAVDARSLGATPESGMGNRPFTIRRTGAVDARSLGATPESGLGNKPFTIRKTGAVDARSLGARPTQTVGLPEKQRFPTRPPTSDQEQAVGLKERRQFPPRVANTGYDQGREPGDRRSRGENSNIQDRYPRGGYGLRPNNDANGIQEDAPQRRSGFQTRSTRGGFTQGPRGGGSASSRPARNRDGGNASRRGRGGGEHRRGRTLSGPAGDVGYVNIWDEEEMAYMKQKKESEVIHSAVFNPHNLQEQGLTKYIPAIMSGEQGISQILEEKLTLAKRHLEGKFIAWDSREQQADVMTLAEALKAEMSEKDDEAKEQENEAVSKEKQEADAVLDKLWMGKYVLNRPTQEKDILGHVARQTDRNESYFPKDETNLLEKVRSILPADAGRRGGGQAGKQVRK